MTPDESIFRLHTASAEFRQGIDEGMWDIVENKVQMQGPFVIIWIAARQKPGCPDKYFFRFNLQNYPSVAPTACPWDVDTDQRLPDEKWPKGGPQVSTVFNPNWNKNALYAPCDRVAMEGHREVWEKQFPDYWWQPHFTIVKYLNFVYRRLNSSDYA